MRFLVVGAGLHGSAAAFELLRQPSTKSVSIVDEDAAQTPASLEPWRGKDLELVRLDLDDEPAVRAQKERAP